MLGSGMAWRHSWVSASRNVTRLRNHRAFSSAPAGLGDKAAGWEYDHDVVVVGGGIVGCTLACRLAKDLSSTTPSTSGLPPLTTGKDDGGGNDGGRGRRRRRPAVGLIEARPPPSLEAALARGSPDPRVYSLAPSSVEVLGKLGVWDEGGGVLKGRSQPFGGMQVWDDRGAGHLRFDGEEKGGKTAALGFISEHGVIHSSLFERVRELEADGLAELTCPAQARGSKAAFFVKRVTFPPVGAGGATGPLTVTVETASGETRDTTCRLLVAADGGDSKARKRRVAKMMGLSSFGWGYGRRAVVATVKLAESHGEVAFQRYLSKGPLAMLPLPGGKLASLVWSTTPEHAESLKSMSTTEFVKEVNDALRLPPTIGTSPSSAAEPASFSGTVPPFTGDHGLFGGLSSLAALPFATASALGEGVAKSAEGVAGALAGLSLGLQEGAGGGGRGGFCTPPEAVEVVTPRLGFDLSLRQAHKYTGDRMALVGDAAHTVHPMAGQGLNLGIADADALARAVLEGRLSGTDVGSKTLLARYEEERK
ncbi:unnamed protein product, partial [Ectocarpus sp. 4 AP-2014]